MLSHGTSCCKHDAFAVCFACIVVRNAALHNTHGPIEAPSEYEAFYTYSDTKRNTFDAMVSVVDRTVKNVTDALQGSNMWKNCLFVWTTDNGSPCQVAGKSGQIIQAFAVGLCSSKLLL